MLPIARCISRISLNKLCFQAFAKCSSKVIQDTVLQQELTTETTVQQTYGQPTPWTHPHLLKEDEVIPGIKVDELKSRRNRLMEKISTATKKLFVSTPHAIVIPSASKVYMSDKIPYVFRQNTDFLYFTGCQEPDSILLMTVVDNKFTSMLFMRPKNPEIELWEGPRTGVNAALSLFQVDQVFPIQEFQSFLFVFLNEHKKSIVWYDKENVLQPDMHTKLQRFINELDVQGLSCPKTFIHELRIIKSKAELSLMKKSCEIASAAISETITKSKPKMSEHELFTVVDYECRMRGAEFLAYPPVVAGGKNANIIHYISNNQIVHEKEMVLMDAGCEYHGYSSDITRTWPINGTFTPEQRILYEITLDIQKTLINKLKEMPSLDSVYHYMCNLLGKRLQEEYLIPKHISSNKLIEAAYTFCPHHVGHYLGMDVHDTLKISRSNPVQPGMIVTIEPGLYVNPKNQFAPREFHGLGIRIEDDILVQENEPEILTRSCPKEVSEIETLARHNQR